MSTQFTNFCLSVYLFIYLFSCNIDIHCFGALCSYTSVAKISRITDFFSSYSQSKTHRKLRGWWCKSCSNLSLFCHDHNSWRLSDLIVLGNPSDHNSIRIGTLNADYAESSGFGRVSISNAKCMAMGLEFFSLQLIIRIDIKLHIFKSLHCISYLCPLPTWL